MSYTAEQTISLGGTCRTGELEIGDEIRVHYLGKDWVSHITRLDVLKHHPELTHWYAMGFDPEAQNTGGEHDSR